MLMFLPLGCCKVAELVRAYTPCALIRVDGLQTMSSLAGCDGGQCLLVVQCGRSGLNTPDSLKDCNVDAL